MNARTPLHDDLALVLPETQPPPAGDPPPESAIAEAAGWLTRAEAPLVTGLEGLTVEGCRLACALAEALGATLALAEARPSHQPACFRLTLGEAMARPLALLVDPGAPGAGPAHAHPVVRRLAARGVTCHAVPAGPDLPTELRRWLAGGEAAAPVAPEARALAERITRAGRVTLALAPGVSPGVTAAWQRLAAQAALEVRLHLLPLPALAREGNRRGAVEVALWQTGLSLEEGGITFAGGAPRPAPDAATLLARGAADLVLEAGIEPQVPAGAARIRIGPGHVPPPVPPPAPPPPAPSEAARSLHLPAPGLVPGGPGHVVRFDNVVLSLSGGERAGDTPPDARILTRLLEALPHAPSPR